MVNFDYQTPTRLIFGKGVVSEKLAGVMSKFGKNVLINPKTLAQSNLLFDATEYKQMILFDASEQKLLILFGSTE